MELGKETILAVVVTELAKAIGNPVGGFLSKYEKLFVKYVDGSSFRGLLEREEPKENWDVVCKAKELALGGQAAEENGKQRPLCSIFSGLSLDGSYPRKMYYVPSIVNAESLMPRAISESAIPNAGCGDGSYMQGFCRELGLLMHSSPEDFDSFLIVLDTLMKKYLWSVPASGKKDEDISLYDFIKASAAIAAAFVQGGIGDVAFIMVAGHFSGIQNYIFSVSKVGTVGVAKRLRARSFYVNAMVSALAHCIVHTFGLPMGNILMLTGGKFFILLPNIYGAVEKLRQIEKQVTTFLYEKFHGNLSLELVWEKVTEDGIRNYSAVSTKLSGKMERKKKRLLESVLINEDGWDTGKFAVYQDLSGKSMCASCRSALVDAGQEMCANCEADTEIGGKLPKIRMFSFSREKGQYQLLDGYYLNLDISAGGEGNYLVMQLNNPKIDGMYHQPTAVYYAVNHVPVKNTSEVKTFGEIADGAAGRKKLGILKADVDTLGFLFTEGLQDEGGEAVPAARVITLSRMLDQFFGGYLNDLIESKYQNVYCVFSGGDDLFFIGPWNEMPALAVDMDKRFHEYTGGNRCMTLSAAICIAESGGHIATLAEYCEEKLKQVKQGADQAVFPDKKGRNGIYFLGKVLAWEDLEKQLGRGKKFADAVGKAGVSVIERLKDYSRMYQDYQNGGDVEKLMFLPLFSNDMRRNGGTLKKDPWLFKHFEELYRKGTDYRKIDKDFYYSEFCVDYALQLTREERKNG